MVCRFLFGRVSMLCLLALALAVPVAAVTRTTLIQEFEGIYYPLTTTTTPCTDVALTAALTAMQAAVPPRAILQLTPIDGAGVACTWTLAANVTVPRGVTLRVPDGVQVSIASGRTLTVNGPLDADDPDWVSGDGTVVLNYPQAQGDTVGSYLLAGCLPTVPGASLTLSAFACQARIWSNGQHYPVYQTAAAVGPLSGGDGQYWVAVGRDTTSVLAGWTRQASTVYLWQKAASLPVEPARATVIAGVTVAAGVITVVTDYRRPASYAYTGRLDVTDPLYGGVVDGVTDNAQALETALHAWPPGAVVEVPAGVLLVSRNVWVCRHNLIFQGRGPGSIVRAAAGFANTGNSGLVEVGVGIGAVACAGVSNVTIRDMTFDGQNLAKSVGVRNLTTGLITHIQALNGGPNGGNIFTNDTSDLVISENFTSGSIGTNGDGIYVGGGTRTRVVNNTIYNFTRIGIVTESGGAGAKTTNTYIAGNIMRHGHNATAPQRNAGYYGENTCDVQLIGNTIEDMTNTPGAVTSVGMRLSVASGGQCYWYLYGNSVSGAQYGLDISVDATDTVVVDGYEIARGPTLTDYTQGIVIQSGYDITLSHITLQPNNWVLGRGIVVSSGPIHSLTISDSTTNPTGTFLSTTSTFNLFAGAVEYLTLHNLTGWDVLIFAAPQHVRVSDSHLLYRTTSVAGSSWMLQASVDLTVINSRLSRVTGAATQMINALAGSHILVSNSVLENFQQKFDNGAAPAATTWVKFVNCDFLDASQVTFFGDFFAIFNGNNWANWPATGAMRANDRNLPMTLIVNNNHFFTTTAAQTPIILSGFAPTVALFDQNTHNSTFLTTMTAAIILEAQGQTFLNLGNRGNGSQIFCSDCTSPSSPCTGGGTGAFALRQAGAWKCP